MQEPHPRNPRASSGVSSFAAAEMMMGFHPEVMGSGSLLRADSLTFIVAEATQCSSKLRFLISPKNCLLCRFQQIGQDGNFLTSARFFYFSFSPLLLQNLPVDKATAMELPPKSTTGARVNEKVCMLILYLSAQTSCMWLFFPAPSTPFFIYIHIPDHIISLSSISHSSFSSKFSSSAVISM